MTFKQGIDKEGDDGQIQISGFENANIMIILERRKLIDIKELEDNLEDLDKLCRQITNFRKSIK